MTADRTAEERLLARSYLRAVLRSRQSVDRIIACVADLVERDEACARALATHPEVLAALARTAVPAPWMLRPAGSASRIRSGKTPAKPYLRLGGTHAPPRRRRS